MGEWEEPADNLPEELDPGSDNRSDKEWRIESLDIRIEHNLREYEWSEWTLVGRNRNPTAVCVFAADKQSSE